MAAPSKYKRGYSFSGFQANSPTRPLPGSSVDEEFDAIAARLGGTIDSLALIQRPDGKLANGIVTFDAVDPSLRLGFAPPKPWVAGLFYTRSDTVSYGAAYYACIKPHVASSSFDNDFAAGDWQLIFDYAEDATPFLDYASQEETRAGANVEKPVRPPEALDLINFKRPFADDETAEAGTSTTTVLSPDGGTKLVQASAIFPTGAEFNRPVADRLSDSINALDYYLPTDGTNLASAINKAIAKGVARGGGSVFIPDLGQVYGATDKITAKSNVYLFSDGSPKIRLANGVNKSLIESDNFLTLSGTNTGSGISNFGIQNIILDGNSANNASPSSNQGHALAIFGRDFYLVDVECINSYRRGCHVEYGNSAVGVSPFNGHIKGLLTDTTGEEGYWNGVSDLHAVDINVRSAGQNANNTYDAIYIRDSIRGWGINAWRGGGATNTHRYGVNVASAGTTIENIHLETAATANLYVGASSCKLSNILAYNLLGSFHVIVNGSGNDIELRTILGGVAGENGSAYSVKLGDTNAVSGNAIRVRQSGTAGGMVNFANDGGANYVQGTAFLPSGGALYTGTYHATSRVFLNGVGSATAEHQSVTKETGMGGAVAPNGTVQGTATVIKATVNRVLATSASHTAVILPKAAPGLRVRIVNLSSSTQTINVFPFSGDNVLGLAANIADTLTPGTAKTYWAHSTTEWG